MVHSVLDGESTTCCYFRWRADLTVVVEEVVADAAAVAV